MSAIMQRPLAAPLRASAPSGSAAHRGSKRAARLKLELSARLRAARAAHALGQRDVHDRPQLVSDWEHPEKRHSPTLLHLVEVGSDPLSRPYALEALEWAAEQLRAPESDPRQLSLFGGDV